MKSTVTYYDLLIAHFTTFDANYIFSTILNEYRHQIVQVNIKYSFHTNSRLRTCHRQDLNLQYLNVA